MPRSGPTTLTLPPFEGTVRQLVLANLFVYFGLAILGLLSAGDTRSDSVAKGVRWLIERQLPDGSWDESMGEGATRQAVVTGTGFPRVFYLAYHLYRNYFPLLALTDYRKAMERA